MWLRRINYGLTNWDQVFTAATLLCNRLKNHQSKPSKISVLVRFLAASSRTLSNPVPPAYINKWLADWYHGKSNITRPVNYTSFPDPTTLPTPSFQLENIPASIVTATVQQYPVLTPMSAIAIPTAMSASIPLTSTSPTKSGSGRRSYLPGFSTLWLIPSLYWIFG